jgi:hypothetical protein
MAKRPLRPVVTRVIEGLRVLDVDGVDFTLLTPTWLAITAFVVLPAALVEDITQLA